MTLDLALTATILIVDDEPQNRKLLEALLQPEGYTTICASNGKEALAMVADSAPDLILLDVMMPGMDGYQVATILKASPTTSSIPIVMVTAQIDRRARITGLEAGVDEFLTKPVDRAELWLRVRNLLRVKAFGDFLKNHNTILDKEVRERTAELLRLAHYDPLTGLLNRSKFYEKLRDTLEHVVKKNWTVAVFFIDVDNFKNINDTLGHALGDELLRQFGNRLIDTVRARDTVSRIGGDEFAVLLVIPSAGRKDVLGIANKILRALNATYSLGGREVAVTASIGIAVHPDDASDPETLILYSDTAMYRAKRGGRNTFRFFTAQMNTEAVAAQELEMAVRKAVENQEFVLYYQPKVHLGTGSVCGVEALLRWERPGHGLVSPAVFIPVLEETGLIVRVGAWVIVTACKQIALWKRASIMPLQVAVNVSSRQFLEGDLEGDVANALEENDVPGDLLELELTEGSLISNTERTIEILQGLKKLGVNISIDDFGTGYSSLAYLRRFPIDKLKIDIAFIRDITHDPNAAAIALTIIRMAHTLKLKVIAEGVESAAQLAYLRRHGCDQIQGYYFSRPLQLAALEQLMLENRRLPPSGEDSPPTLGTLLLVDNDVESLEMLQHELRNDGYTILTARSATDGLEQLALNRVQVIISGQRMPGLRGKEFLERVKDMYPETVQLILTNNADLDSVINAINHGAIYRYYTKPWGGDEMREGLKGAFRHHELLLEVQQQRLLEAV